VRLRATNDRYRDRASKSDAVGGIRSSEAVRRIERVAGEDIVRTHLKSQNRDIRIEKEIQIDVRNVERDGVVGLREADARLSHIVTPVDTEARLTVDSGGLLTGARLVEEALYIGKESDELLVVPLLEIAGIRAELVYDLAPWTAGDRFERFPMPLNLLAGAQRHELQRPDDDLAKVSDDEIIGDA